MWGFISRNPADDAGEDIPAAAKRKATIWSPEQLGRFLDSVKDDRYLPMWVLFATTGLRRGEVAGLTWSAVDLDAGTVTVAGTRVLTAGKIRDESPKTEGSTRSISLDPVTVTALRTHKARQAEERLAWGEAATRTDYVFTYEDGRPLHPQLISERFLKAGQAVGLSRIRLHDLRHSYASAAIVAGVPLKVVQTRLGHARIETTANIYSHVLENLERESGDKVAKLIVGSF